MPFAPTPARPPYDSELAAVLDATDLPDVVTPEMIPMLRIAMASPPIETLLGTRAIDHRLVRVLSEHGDLVVSVLRPKDQVDPLPAILYLHAGGMIIGDRFTFIESALDWVEELGVVVVTVEYRLAPEHPDPAPIEDAYDGLRWLIENHEDLRIDPSRVVVAGMSAGAGLAAGVALLARDRQGPPLLAQLLTAPMLDDRNDSVSSRQYTRAGTWSHESNDTGWDALLGDGRGTADVSPYAAPARATDLAGLPQAFIDVGSAEVFRDEDVEYASRLWAAGVQAELHVWAGGFHGFDAAAPTAAVSVTARATRNAWLSRILSPSDS